MNKSIMMGRLVRDPDIRYTEGQNGELAIANFRLAVDRKYAKEDAKIKADFFRCTAFGRWAEFAERFLFQGIKVVVQGRMQNENYTNRDGDKVYGVCLIVDDIDFAESKSISDKIREENETENDADTSRGNSRKRKASSENSERRSGKTSRAQDTERSSKRSESSSSRNPARSTARNSGRNHRNDDVDDQFQDMDEFDEDSLGFD